MGNTQGSCHYHVCMVKTVLVLGKGGLGSCVRHELNLMCQLLVTNPPTLLASLIFVD